MPFAAHKHGARGHRHGLHGHRHGPGVSRHGLVPLIFVLFWMAAVTCMLWSVQRIARSLTIVARVRALKALRHELTDEERTTLVERVRHDSLRRF